MKLCFGLLLALMAGCNQSGPLKGLRDIRPGQTSLHEALQLLEDPARVTTLESRPTAQIYHWEEMSLQVEHKLVQAIFREPNPTEESFLYWRHAYRQLPTTLEKLPGQNQWQFTIPSEGVAVIYDEGVDAVTKVVQYEAP